MDFATIDQIDQQLKQEEQASLPMSRVELESRQAIRAEIHEQLDKIHYQVKNLSDRFNRLEKLPVVAHCTWASALLRFPNLVFVVIDTAGVQKDSDVIRVLVADAEGSPIFDRIVRPVRQKGQPNTTYTGIVYSQIKDAPTLADIWSDLQAALVGRYVLAYNMDFLKQRLDENAAYYHVPPIEFVGECLMERAASYYRVSPYPLKLTDICARVGLTLGQQATAPDRAVGQLTFLRAMAEGITNVHRHFSPLAISEENDDQLDEHPF